MADALARRGKDGDPSPVGTMTAAQWFDFLGQYTLADTAVKEANAKRKELRDKIKIALVDADLIEAFDRARKSRDLSGEYRAKQEAAYARLMDFERKPVGYQGGLQLPMTSADAARVDFEGLEAGKSKHNRGDNPYVPGSDEFARWDDAWLRGQATIASSLTDDPAKKAATLGVINGGKGTPDADKPKRGPGRPRKNAAESTGQRAPDAGEGGDTGETEEGGTAGDPPSENQPQGDPPTDRGGEQQGAPDRYGDVWPSHNGNGNDGETQH